MLQLESTHMGVLKFCGVFTAVFLRENHLPRYSRYFSSTVLCCTDNNQRITSRIQIEDCASDSQAPSRLLIILMESGRSGLGGHH